MINVLAWIAIVIGLTLPVVSVLYIPKKEVFFILFLPSVIISMAFNFIGLSYSTWMPFNKNIGIFIFTLCFVEVTISSFIYIFYVCKKGLQFLESPNPWDKINKKASLFIRLFLLSLFMLLSSFIFSPLYSLWNILSTHNVEIGVGDAFYYGISVVYAIPQTGLFQQFQHDVNSDIMLRVIQVVHVIVTKLIEFIVIGFIIGQIRDLLMTKKAPEIKSNRRKQVFMNAQRSRRQRFTKF